MSSALLDGKYEVLEKISEGGMGTLYLARHVPLGAVRVIKLMRSKFRGDAGARRRFRREAQTALRIQHPNIVRFFDYELQEDGTSLLVMEYIHGVDLATFIREHPIPPVGVCLEIVHQSLEALGQLHALGVVHRDISPENMMLTPDGAGKLLVKVIDLGLAKPLSSEQLTETGIFMGKVKYASPEQVGPQRLQPVGPRSDVYSLGVVLYELLTGTSPFLSETPGGFVYAHLSESPRPFDSTDLQHRIPEDVRRVVRRALAKDPLERFDAKAFDQALAPARERCGSEGIADTIRRIEKLREAQASRRQGVTGSLISENLASATPEIIRGRRHFGGAIVWTSVALILFGLSVYLARGSLSGGRLESVRTAGSSSVAKVAPAGGTTVVGHLSITSNPWARVEQVMRLEDGKSIFLRDNRTPLFLTLPSGKYRLRFASSEDSRRYEVEEYVETGRVKPVHIDFPGFDAERLIQAYVR